MQTSAKAGILFVIVLMLVPAVAAEDALGWYTLGQNAVSAGNYADALTYYNNAIALDASYAQALAGKAVALNALGQYTDALDAANRALAIRTSSDGQNAQAYALFKLGRYNEAVAAYVNYTADVTNNAAAYCNLAYSYAQVGNADSSINAYTSCTSLNPQNADAWNQLGLVYMSQGEYSDALDAFNASTKVTVTNAEIWNNKGLALAALGRYQDALSCFNKALSIDPAYADAEKNKESMMGKAQVYQINGSPTVTAAPWVLGGVKTTTPATAATTGTAVTVSATPTGSLSGVNDVVATESETPVAARTTYTPLSPLGAVAACSAAMSVLFFCRRQKE